MRKHFSLSWRTALFLLFVFAFLVSAPLVVLYTAGYRYHAGSHKIVETGVLSISSVPRSATVILDGKPLRDRTPLVIDNVLPGPHTVSLKKEGHHDWDSVLDVYSKQTTFIDDAILFFKDGISFIDETPDEPLHLPIREQEFHGQRVKIDVLNNRSVLSFVETDGVSRIIAYLPVGSYGFTEAPSGLLALYDSKRYRLVIIDPKQDQPILASEIARSWDWKEDRSLLFSDGFDVNLFSAYTSEHTTITRLSEPIVDVAWYPKGQVALFATATRIVASQTNMRANGNEIELAVLDDIESVDVDKRGDVLTIVGSVNGVRGLYARRLQK
jgi:hypothetical protein